MNYIINERGEEVIAVGSPNSPERMRVKYPDQLNNEYKRVWEILDSQEDQAGKVAIQFVGEADDFLAFEDAVWYFIKNPDH